MTQIHDQHTGTNYRVRPAVWIGLAIYVGYVAVFTIVERLSGVDYDDIGDTAGTLFRGADIALIIGTVLLVITTSLLGWWRPALYERRRSGVRWPIIAPILMTVALVFNLAGTDWSAYDGAFFAASLVLLLVGFTEEMTTRGLLLTALRSRLGEGWVWFITSALFGLLHLVNAFLGQPIGPTVQQIVFAFLAGTVFYILRRVTGTLIWAMVLHALWDFSTFASGHGQANALSGLSVLVQIPAFIVALIAVAFVIRGANERTVIDPTVPGAQN
ncbi:hypothetical protein B0I08_102254 [Glaciihabitans tibetensis]|uniref:CAAX prenyl protease 2/Lysostaphin resistance protein A-like domain-containing protein n=1 Tax=Glaciihabitans tibetensis TaxID=1266600 RepID=A0A2T0VH84_9MICO|nr:CPBP family intramembrane glutamic endopeptidase [Glaciihabitans tibetensis]PRY69578.1 hypothetical protein B0I08_102254 [Glaciihabitans tibetensis]